MVWSISDAMEDHQGPHPIPLEGRLKLIQPVDSLHLGALK